VELFFKSGKISNNSTDIIKTKMPPNSQLFIGAFRKRRARLMKKIRIKMKMLRQKALLSLSKRLKIEKKRKKSARITRDISPRMTQIFMA